MSVRRPVAASILQADLELLDSLTLVGTVGYNKISFDETVRTGTAIIYSKDAPIPGSGAPWVGSLAAIYDFVAFGSRDGYARLDYLYSGEPRPTRATDPKSATSIRCSFRTRHRICCMHASA